MVKRGIYPISLTQRNYPIDLIPVLWTDIHQISKEFMVKQFSFISLSPVNPIN